jgi:hypothetical protein
MRLCSALRCGMVKRLNAFLGEGFLGFGGAVRRPVGRREMSSPWLRLLVQRKKR